MATNLQNILDSILSGLVVEGRTGRMVAETARKVLSVCGYEPAFLNYKPRGWKAPEGYPDVMCISFNNEVIHGIPDDREFQEGDVVKLDLGIKQDGVYDDGATTVIVGKGSATARRLVRATQEALAAAILQAKAGNTTHDIARAIEDAARQHDVTVIEGYGGHGIGAELHMEPFVPNRVSEGPAVELKKGMRIAIEPMFCTSKSGQTVVALDGWTIRLPNGGLAAHFEKTVEI